MSKPLIGLFETRLVGNAKFTARNFSIKDKHNHILIDIIKQHSQDIENKKIGIKFQMVTTVKHEENKKTVKSNRNDLKCENTTKK